MMKPKRPILFAALLSLLSLLLIFLFLKGKEASFNALEEPLVVLVARKDIPRGILLDEVYLTQTKIPKRFLQPGVLFSFEEIKNKVTAAPILKGEQVLATKLTTLGFESGLAVRLPLGKRGVSIEVDEGSGVASLIRPNNFVDVMVTLSGGAQTLAQRVLVLAVDQDLGEGYPLVKKEKSSPLGDVFNQSRKKTVTLALTPKEAQEIVLAKEEGKIQLALRPQWEEDILNISPITTRDVTGVQGTLKSNRYREYSTDE